MRVQAFDGLRAILALWVVLAHLAPPVGVKVPIVANPAVAVDLFMVLSGFLIATTHARLNSQYGHVTGNFFFWTRRVMRIWPLYIFLVTIAWVFSGPLREAKIFSDATLIAKTVASSGVTGTNSDMPSISHILWHISMLFGLYDKQATSTLLPDWSLSLEFQFYLLFPLVSICYARRPLVTCFAAAALAYISPRLFGFYTESGTWAHFWQPAMITYRLNMFLVGSIAYYLFSQPPTEALRGPTRDAHLIALLLCMSVVGVRSAFGVIAVIFVLSHPDAKICQWLGKPVMAWMGRISFSIYLCHLLLLRAVLAALASQSWFVTQTPALRFAIACAILVPLVVLVSHALYLWIEMPGNRLAHRWTSPQKKVPGARSVTA